jgi:hypothetical protein
MNRPMLPTAFVLGGLLLILFGCGKPEVIDEATKVRIDKIKRETLPIFEVIAEMERFSQKERQIAITKLMDKGWPAAIADLEYLDAHLPKDDPDRYRVEKYLKAAKQAMDKSRSSQ